MDPRLPAIVAGVLTKTESVDDDYLLPEDQESQYSRPVECRYCRTPGQLRPAGYPQPETHPQQMGGGVVVDVATGDWTRMFWCQACQRTLRYEVRKLNPPASSSDQP